MAGVFSFPVYVLVDEDRKILPSAKAQLVKPSELPDKGTFYVLTADGLQIHQDTKIIKAMTPIDSIPGLASFQQTAKLRLPKLPPLILLRAWKFFRKVWDEYKAEAEVMLLWNKDEQVYDLWCPKQSVSGGGVHYEMSEEMAQVTQQGWQWVGTIHSHCDFSAYHSGVDVADERDEDGIHITIGHVNLDACSLASTIKVGTKRWEVAPENVSVGVQIEQARPTRSKWIGFQERAAFFTVNAPEGDLKLLNGPFAKQIDREWFPKVTEDKRRFKGSQSVVWVREEEDDEDGEYTLVDGKWKFVPNGGLDETEQ